MAKVVKRAAKPVRKASKVHRSVKTAHVAPVKVQTPAKRKPVAPPKKPARKTAGEPSVQPIAAPIKATPSPAERPEESDWTKDVEPVAASSAQPRPFEMPPAASPPADAERTAQQEIAQAIQEAVAETQPSAPSSQPAVLPARSVSQPEPAVQQPEPAKPIPIIEENAAPAEPVALPGKGYKMIAVKVRRNLLRVVPGAEVLLLYNKRCCAREITDNNGEAFFSHLSDGEYELELSHDGKMDGKRVRVKRDTTTVRFWLF